jgi:hypothetical protein
MSARLLCVLAACIGCAAPAHANTAAQAEAALQAELAQAAAARQAQAASAAAADRAADAARRAQTARLAADALAGQAQAEAAHEARLKRLQTACGADFQRPQVGMALARAQQCVGDLVPVHQVQRTDGVATVYQAGPLYITALGGKVVAWTNTRPTR